MLKIAMAGFRYLPAIGGSTRVFQLLAEAIVRKGHEVTFVTQEEPGCPSTETIAGVNVIRLPMRHVAGFRLPRGYVAVLKDLERTVDVFH
ncbi:MAG: glycosyltransferase, partial [Thermoplasmata archaeon]